MHSTFYIDVIHATQRLWSVVNFNSFMLDQNWRYRRDSVETDGAERERIRMVDVAISFSNFSFPPPYEMYFIGIFLAVPLK